MRGNLGRAVSVSGLTAGLPPTWLAGLEGHLPDPLNLIEERTSNSASWLWGTRPGSPRHLNELEMVTEGWPEEEVTDEIISNAIRALWLWHQ